MREPGRHSSTIALRGSLLTDSASDERPTHALVQRRRMEVWEADDARRRHMARFGRRDTAPELALRRELHARGRRFFVDRRVSTTSRARPDIVFPRARIAVFVDGCFWHWCEAHAHLPKTNAALWRAKLLANRQRDARNEATLIGEGWQVIRVWEHAGANEAADLVEHALDRWDTIAGARHGRTVPCRSSRSSRR
ncbi:very short patch repair endonuclease [Curtobacterium sp. PhB130]|uniref:very short patch repair endonuclease n=1 Tax=Curtobacterium sp. PhB130 TaxID=2485178 RepID=UPI00288B86A6|nr:very short patch repair endonuclease [Curtobacterium sp. PhB130]